MSLYYALGILIPNMVTNYILFRFFDEAYERKYSKAVYVIAYFIIVLFQSTIVFLRIPFFSLITFSIIVILLAIAGYRSDTRNKVICTVMYMIYLVFIDVVVVPLFAAITGDTVAVTMDNEKAFFLTGIVSAVIGLSTYKLVADAITRRKVRVLTRSQKVFIVLLGCFELGAIHAIARLGGYNETQSNAVVVGLFVGFILLDTYIILLVESVSQNNELRMKAFLLEQQAIMEGRYYDEMEAQNEKYRKIMHDIREHVSFIQQEAAGDGAYCQEVLELISEQGYRFKCTNPILNLIINDRLLTCEQKEIAVEMDVEDVDLSFMRKTDITTIFLNLMNNAIEECNELEPQARFLHLTIKEVQGHIVVVIANSCRENIFTGHREGVSRKQGHMGLGLQNVRAALRRYDTHLSIECRGGEFSARFVVQKN